jgi:beta-lactamase regulating signal transducer with metallopeptidase domain
MATFVHECLASGGLFLALAATLVLPFVAWVLTRPALALVRGEGAPLSRAFVFATLATAPGVSFAVGTATIVIASYRAGCLNWVGGRTIVGAILLLFATFAVRATIRAFQRYGEIRMLRATSDAPNARVTLVAHRAGVIARRVNADHPVLCLVGLRKPVVLVSDAALARLSEAELRASFAHERAHVQHFDQLLMTLVAFFADLFPMPVDDLIERYCIAREFAADRAALHTVDAVDLAQAIYRLAVPKTHAFGAALADRGAAARVRALLQPTTAHDQRIIRNLSLLVAGQGLIVVTLVALLLPLSTCRMVL